MLSETLAQVCGEPQKTACRPGGVVVLGGHYGALGLVRSLGRHGIPAVLVRRGEHIVASFSRYVTCVMNCPTSDNLVDFLVRVAGTNLHGWLLLPTTDETVALIARSADELSRDYALMSSSWATIEQLCDKRALYKLAGRLGIDRPWTVSPKNSEEVANLDCEFPVIVKPAHREMSNPLTYAKAWQANNRDELLTRYQRACKFMPRELIMIQEVVPGGGETQFSFVALCFDGRVLASAAARRTRQFPRDYGRSSSYVETIPDPGFGNAAIRLLKAVNMTGLVEVEFKRDPAGKYRLLDVNPRVWTWHMLCGRAGIDFPYLLWLLACGESFVTPQARPGISWMHFSSDFLVAVQEICRGRLSLNNYLRSVLAVRESALLAADDPVPAILDVPTSLYRLGRRALQQLSRPD